MTPTGGMSVVCTGVTPIPPNPPQNGLAPRRGDEGRSFWVFGVMSGVVDGTDTGVGAGEPGGERGAPVWSSAGGGRSGECRESRRQRLRADIS